MTEEQKVPPTGEEPTGANAESSWHEVGQQFQALGESLAQAVRTAWENEETQRRVQEMRTGLESMVDEVGKAIDESSRTPEAQKIRQEAGRTVDSLRAAGEKTAQEVRPQLIEALQQLNSELQQFIHRMEQQNPAQTSQPPSSDKSDPGTPA
jgi:ElaB/YqjD/DUF883 family membrane-anchored ribosome-binding protein